MELGLSLRISWICLLFSGAACFPAKGDYRYPYAAPWGSSSGPAPGSNLQPEGSRGPLVSLQAEAVPQQPSSSTGNQSPSGLGAPSVAAGSSATYEPNRFIVTYESGSKAPEVPSQSAGYVGPQPPAGTGVETSGFNVQPQNVASTSGSSNVGSVHQAPPSLPPSGFAYPAGAAGSAATTFNLGDVALPYSNTPSSRFGDGPVPYSGAPSFGSSEVPLPYSGAPSFGSSEVPLPYSGAPSFGSSEVPLPYSGAPSFGSSEVPLPYSGALSSSFGDGPVPYSNTPSFGGPVPSFWDAQPAGGAHGYNEPSNWMPSAPSDLNVWGSDGELPQSVSEPFPLPPSSYIIQSKNGYQRERELFSYTEYSPETSASVASPSSAVRASAASPSNAVRAPSRPAPMTVARGGQKV
ncbi:uncharacterized protein [Chaetodon trifascialis]|uniref:uncharacterized protein n=1 Tax=Chaetodon trifascialis TaxID=109706 RepID=UPI003994B1A6